MRKPGLQWLALAMTAGVLVSATAVAETYYEVTVTNVTKGMTFTPILVATTRRGDTFFHLGDPASNELETMAETGNVAPLAGSLDAFDFTDSSFLPFLGPGQSVTQVVAGAGPYRHISLASMLIPSNDTFIALNGVPLPRGNKTITYASPAYDAGSELNDELCASLPGPGCDMDPGPASAGEGYVYISGGIRGVGDLDADALDWHNPVAIIAITRVGHDD